VILTIVTLFGQSVSSTIGALFSGQPLKQSVQTGMSLSQIGEFSFIIAAMGMTLNVTSDFLYPIVVAVSAVTTFTTPFMVKFSTPFSEYLSKKLPRRWIKRIERYSANTQAIKSVSNWQIVINSYLTQLVVFSTIILAVILLSSKYLLPLVDDFKYGNALGALITLVAVSPFLWALSLRRFAANEVSILIEERKYRGPIIMMFLFRLLLSIFFIGFLLNIFFSPKIAFLVLIAAIIVYFIFQKRLNGHYYKIEGHFLKNLNDREIAKVKKNISSLSPWDEHMAFFDIAPASDIAGKTLKELQIREQMGINIASIKRGEFMINIPKADERLFPGDEICVIGTDVQVKEFKTYLDQHEIDIPDNFIEPEIVLQQIELKNESYIGKTIRDSKLREKTNGLIVGIEKKRKRILNPESNVILEKDDILWIVGDKNLLADLVHN
jgi:CPA2 family monovalent cation:H+ antiporter-2